MDSIESSVGAWEQELWEHHGWWARNWLEGRGLSEPTIKKARLGYDNRRKSIVIPYLNPTGSVRTYRYRSLNGEPKYIWPRGTSIHLYNVVYTKRPKVWVCEGEFDSLILQQMGFDSVGVPGVNSFAPEWKYLFTYCEEVTIVFDGDLPGKDGAQRLAALLGPLVSKIRLVRLPEGRDVTDLYKEDRAKLVELVS